MKAEQLFTFWKIIYHIYKRFFSEKKKSKHSTIRILFGYLIPKLWTFSYESSCACPHQHVALSLYGSGIYRGPEKIHTSAFCENLRGWVHNIGIGGNLFTKLILVIRGHKYPTLMSYKSVLQLMAAKMLQPAFKVHL